MNSRGDPTVEVEVETDVGKATADVPSGVWAGEHEAFELRDNDPTRREGKGVTKVIAHIEGEIAEAVIGKSFEQRNLDAFLCELDGTPNKSRLGENAILPVSIAFSRVAARALGQPLYQYLAELGGTKPGIPCLLFNALQVRDSIEIQECLIASVGDQAVKEQVAAATACMAALHPLLGFGIPMGDSGGFAPLLSNSIEALDLLSSAVSASGYPAGKLTFAVTGAANRSDIPSKQRLGRQEILALYAELAQKYPLVAIEDPYAQDDWEGFISMTSALGDRLLVVGDYFTATNAQRIKEAVALRAGNACVIKPNQIGTVSETIDAVRAARTGGWKVCASHRAGETMDTFISDFAVGLSCDYLKAGAPTKEERMVKYARLMDIEKELS